MAVVLARDWPRPKILGEHTTVTSITVPLIAGAADDLRRLRERTRLSTTDLANRAITSYEFFDACPRVGHDLIVRDNRTGGGQACPVQLAPRSGQVTGLPGQKVRSP